MCSGRSYRSAGFDTANPSSRRILEHCDRRPGRGACSCGLCRKKPRHPELERFGAGARQRFLLSASGPEYGLAAQACHPETVGTVQAAGTQGGRQLFARPTKARTAETGFCAGQPDELSLTQGLATIFLVMEIVMSTRRRKLSGREEAELERLLDRSDVALADLYAQIDQAVVVLREHHELMQAALDADRAERQPSTVPTQPRPKSSTAH